MQASLEIHKLTFIPNGPRGEKIGVKRVAPLPVIFQSNSNGEHGYVGSALKSYTFQPKYQELSQRYGQDNVSVVRPNDAEAVRTFLLASYLTLGSLDASQNYRNVRQFEDIAPSNIALIALEAFLEKDLPHLVSDKIVRRNIFPDNVNLILEAYTEVLKDSKYTHYDMTLMRTFSNITV